MNNLLDKNKNTRNIRRRGDNATTSFLKSFSISFSVILAIAFLLYLPDAKNAFIDLTRLITGKNTARFEFKLPFSVKRQNILVLGVDISDNDKMPFKGVRSDSLSIVSIAPYAKDVNIISIPRDSKVYLSDRNKPDKINHAFAKGGIDLTVSTIEEMFGIRIDHYLIFSTKALIEFIDQIEGLPIYVEKDMHYYDATAGLRVNLSKGEHVLSGKETEGYVRFRNDALGDIGRISRQQWFINALAHKLKSPKTLMMLPEAIKSALKYIKTDMSIYQITQFAGILKVMNQSKIHIVTVPGTPSSRNEISYWILDPEKTQQIIDILVYRDKPKKMDRPINAGILYLSERLELAQDINKQFETNGLETKIVNKSSLLRSQISIHNLDVPMDFIYEIKRQFPELEELPMIYDLVGFNRAGKDITIILAK